jgi:hypothetical protein
MYRWFWMCKRSFVSRAKHILGIFRDFSRGQRVFWPLNCPEHREEEFCGQKSWGPLEKYQEMHHYMFCPRQKINPLHFQNQRYIVFLCPKERERGGREKEIFFEFCFEFAELFEFEIRTALWATAGNQIFLEQALDLKLGWCKPSLVLFIYLNFLASLSL